MDKKEEEEEKNMKSLWILNNSCPNFSSFKDFSQDFTKWKQEYFKCLCKYVIESLF